MANSCSRVYKLAFRYLIKSFDILYSFHFIGTFNVACLLFALLSNYVPSNRFLARPKLAIYVSWEIKFVLRGKVIHYSVSCYENLSRCKSIVNVAKKLLVMRYPLIPFVWWTSSNDQDIHVFGQSWPH